MELNRKAEVSIHGQAADIEFTVERIEDNVWLFRVKDLFNQTEKVLTLTNAQAAATLALFVGEMDNKTLNAALYEIAEEVWKNVDQEHRLIP